MEHNRSPTEEEASTPLTAKDVRQHNTESDAWVIYRGRVYDVTSYLDYHPGGEREREGAEREESIVWLCVYVQE